MEQPKERETAILRAQTAPTRPDLLMLDLFHFRARHLFHGPKHFSLRQRDFGRIPMSGVFRHHQTVSILILFAVALDRDKQHILRRPQLRRLEPTQQEIGKMLSVQILLIVVVVDIAGALQQNIE